MLQRIIACYVNSILTKHHILFAANSLVIRLVYFSLVLVFGRHVCLLQFLFLCVFFP